MARITVEDCLENVSNRFSLVLVSAERTKQLLRGADPLIDNDSDNKEVVTALREIAAGKFEVDESHVHTHDLWLPHHRRDTDADASMDADLPAEIDDLPPEV